MITIKSAPQIEKMRAAGALLHDVLSALRAAIQPGITTLEPVSYTHLDVYKRQGLKRISKPGLRVYAKNDEIPRVLGGLGIAIVSTSKGVMSDKSARAAGIGGEVLAYVW